MRFLGLRQLTIIVLAVLVYTTGCSERASPGPDLEVVPDAEMALIQIELGDNGPVGGVQRIAVDLGAAVNIEVTGDSADEVHIHGYDLFLEVVDGVARLSFDALIPGRFEIELEGSGQLLAELTVS